MFSRPGSDEALLESMRGDAAWIGIDVPLGWPDGFVTAPPWATFSERPSSSTHVKTSEAVWLEQSSELSATPHP